MINNYNKGNELSFDSLPNAVQALNLKMDRITILLESSKPKKQKNKFLTVQEAANFLNLTKPTVYSKVSKGELPHMKKGKRLYFSLEELVDHIKSGKVKSISEIENGVDDYLSKHKIR